MDEVFSTEINCITIKCLE